MQEILCNIGVDHLIKDLNSMVLIRQFEARGELSYQMGRIGGFYHSYSGQEAIQTAAVRIFGLDPWYITSYRCHALALLLGASPRELMAELYGKQSGNTQGRGGSMHFVTDRLLGGFGIVGGQIPIAIGAAFSAQYLEQENGCALCFMGEGAVAQGAFHESLNLASLWNLPVLFIIENNQWGMGTHVSRAIAASPIGEKQAYSYDIECYSMDGMQYTECCEVFYKAKETLLNHKRPVLIEAQCERFKGHSISDPGLYRTKEHVHKVMERDPIVSLYTMLLQENLITAEAFSCMQEAAKAAVIDAMDFADKSPITPETSLEEGVYAP